MTRTDLHRHTPNFAPASGRRVLAGLLLGLALAPATQAAPLSLGQLMAGLAAKGEETATFSEKKYIAILDAPVESSGELRFVAPHRLEKRTLKPRPEALVLDGDTLTLERGRLKRVARLQDHPEIAGMIESIRGTLAGDRKALEKVYHLALEGTAARWTLVLTPLDPKVAALIARVRMDGEKDEVRTVEILQADGDRSVMRIDPVAAR